MALQDNKAFIESYKALKGKQALEARTKKSMQPIIEIDGHPFYVDLRIGLLQPKDDFSTMGIELSKLWMDRDSRKMVGYYDMDAREVIADHAVNDYPPNIVKLEIPNLYVLDPVGMARKEGKDDDKYYIQDGIRQKMYHKANITPLQNQVRAIDKMNALKQNRANVKVKVTTKRKTRGI